MKKRVLSLFFLLLTLSALSPAVFAEELIVGGRALGIELRSDGVIVTAFSDVLTASGPCCPARDAGLKEGDVIVRLGETDIHSAEDFLSAVAALQGGETQLTARREGKTFSVTLAPAQADTGQWMLGMWLRDGVSGIGTLTFVEPDSGTFGALGHSVNDESQGQCVLLRSGEICAADIRGIRPGTAGNPGELSGAGDGTEVLGSIERNVPQGIFGHVEAALDGTVLPTGELHSGPATIFSTVSGREVREFRVEIDRVYSDGGTTRALLTVTDPELLAATGGIVQGMSGSPIVQDGRLAGAVTHVFVDDPKRGFGIGIDDMLEVAGIAQKAA